MVKAIKEIITFWDDAIPSQWIGHLTKDFKIAFMIGFTMGRTTTKKDKQEIYTYTYWEDAWDVDTDKIHSTEKPDSGTDEE
jgi:hypothetical protein